MTTAARLSLGVEYPDKDNKFPSIPTSDLYLIKPATYFANYSIKFACTKLSGDMQRIKVMNPNAKIILDAKVGDVPSTAIRYARCYFDLLEADGVTLNPYGGSETITPFLKYEDKQIYIWLRSHEPGANDFQDRLVNSIDSPAWEPLYVKVARKCMTIENNENMGFMVGCGNSTRYDPIREIARFKRPMLLTGFGSRMPTEQELAGLLDCPATLIQKNEVNKA